MVESAAASSAPLVSQQPDPLVVVTDAGPVRGKSGDGVRRFLGVPFAAPPVGALRWRPPRKPAPWTEVRDASTASAACPQFAPIGNAALGDEDCLTVNVVAPESPPADPAPVMVWLHGGAFILGNGNALDPVRLVADRGVVVVNVQYRLGPLGFLALSALRDEHPRHSSGNLGLEDQQAALRWVRQNIGAFGGDPSNVTLFGQSAGGISVCQQLLARSTAKLFDRAITQSGPCLFALPTRGEAEEQGARFATRLGCSDSPNVLTCLRDKPVSEVLGALPLDPTFLHDQSVRWLPTRDGVVVPRDPEARFREGRFRRVPMIIGANKDEGRLFVGLAFNLPGNPITPETWATEVDRYFGTRVGAEVRRRYPLERYPDAGAAFGQAVGDSVLACPAIESASLMAKHTPVYLYEYGHTPNPFAAPTPGIDLGAFHTSELPYVFNSPSATSGPINFTMSEQALAETVKNAWTSFAATGMPGAEGIRWPRLTSDSTRFLVLDTPPRLDSDLKRDQCAFWEQLD